jgi:hypothetical protein
VGHWLGGAVHRPAFRRFDLFGSNGNLSAMTERDSDFWMAERGMKVRLEAQDPSGKWIAIFPAQLEQMVQQGAPVRAIEVEYDDPC